MLTLRSPARLCRGKHHSEPLQPAELVAFAPARHQPAVRDAGEEYSRIPGRPARGCMRKVHRVAVRHPVRFGNHVLTRDVVLTRARARSLLDEHPTGARLPRDVIDKRGHQYLVAERKTRWLSRVQVPADKRLVCLAGHRHPRGSGVPYSERQYRLYRQPGGVEA